MWKKRPESFSSPAAPHPPPSPQDPKKLVHEVLAEGGVERYKDFLQNICQRGDGSARSTQTMVWGSILGEEVPCWWRQAPHWALHSMGQRDGTGATQLGPGPGCPAKQGCISSPSLILSPHHPLGTLCPGCGPLASSGLPGIPLLFPRAFILIGLAPPRAAVPSSFACPAQP